MLYTNTAKIQRMGMTSRYFGENRKRIAGL
jgi:hypothetical protein